MAFRIQGLPADTFCGLFSKSDEELAELGMKRYVADQKPGFPCRVSLQDAEVGETLILGPFEHHGHGPYRASGPIFVREKAAPSDLGVNEVPELLSIRPISLRGYDRSGLMRDADVVDGRDLASAIERLFSDSQIEYIHAHYASPGCFACAIQRA